MYATLSSETFLISILTEEARERYTQIFTVNPTRSIYYSLLLHVTATRYGHLQGATNFIEVYSIYCK